MNWFIKALHSLNPFKDETGTIPPLRNTDAQKPVSFYSLYVLGEEFYRFHEDVKTKDFAKWLKNHKTLWYKDNKKVVEAIERLQFSNLIEDIYNKNLGTDVDYDNISRFLYRWYIQAHGVFRFSLSDRLFLPLCDQHLLQVLYNVPSSDISQLNSSDDILKILKTPADFKNNWFIGTNNCNDLDLKIAAALIPNVDISMAHFKFISNTDADNTQYKNLLKDNGIFNYVEASFASVTTLPNDQTTQERFKRYDQFNDFSESAELIYRKFLKTTPKAKRFDDFYLLNVWSDKSHPKNDTIYVNVSFGNRILTVSHRNRGFTSTPEEGARLCFYRMEDGFVTITLYPARTENRHPLEDSIVIEQHFDPQNLSTEKQLKKFWNDLIAYMECTSIDGSPSYCQKRMISNLRFKKHLIVGNVFQPTIKSTTWKGRWEFVKTIGMSGCVIAILQLAYNYFNPDTSVQDASNSIVMHIDKSQEKVITALDSINKKIEIQKKKTVK